MSSSALSGCGRLADRVPIEDILITPMKINYPAAEDFRAIYYVARVTRTSPCWIRIAICHDQRCSIGKYALGSGPV